MKKFFANHYEKVILVLLLLLCVGLLSFYYNFVSKKQDEKVDNIVNRPEPEPDFPKANYASLNIFKTDVIFDKGMAWSTWKLGKQKKQALGEKCNAEKIDLMTGQQLSVCPFCLYAIPSECFPKMDAKENGNCPKCKAVLVPRKSNQNVVQVDPADVKSVDNDVNNNGIPDEWEKRYGLGLDKTGKVEKAAKEVGDKIADDDADGDKFSNREEFLAKTNPKDPKSHPLYVTLLKLDGELESQTIEDYYAKLKDDKNVIFDIMFHSMTSGGVVTFDVKYKDPKGKKKFLTAKPKAKVGEEIQMNGKFATGFFVTEVIQPDKSKKGKEKDFGSVKIKKDLGDGKFLELVCFKQKPIQMPEKQVNFDLLGEKLHYKLGDVFVLGNDVNGKEFYTVTKVVGTSADDTEVVLTDKAGKTYTFRLKPVPASATEPASSESKK